MKKLSMGRIMLLLVTLIISRNSFGQHHVQGNWGNTYLYFDDDSSSVPPKTIAVYRNENGPLYTLRMEGDKVLDLTVDSHAVPSDSINGSYKAVIQEIKAQVERARVQARLDRQQAERDREQAEKDRQQAGRDQEQAERDRQQAGRDREQAERDREQADRDRKRAAEDRAIMQSIMDDLVKDGLASDKESIHSLKINADEFLLNGKPLPEAVQKKYIAKYVTGKGYSMSYHNNED
jgi:colicin import membrane protein